MKRSTAILLACLAASISFDAALFAAPATLPATNPALVLPDNSATGLQREEAARQLLEKPTDQGRQLLLRALEDTSDQQGQLAVAKALQNAQNPDRVYLLPLRLLMTDRTLTEAAAAALANYRHEPEALRLLINFASSRQQRQPDRVIAIRAIGTIADKAAAEFLVSLVLRDDDLPRIRNAAADALVDMTGKTENGREYPAWQAWWAANAQKSDAEWKQEIIEQQAMRYVRIRTQYEQLTGELQTILTRVYAATPPSQQTGLLLTYLRSNHPEIRRFGAMMVYSEAMAARPVAAEAIEQLRYMLSDSSRNVRLAVATALLATNDPGALDALLTQIGQERDAEVRAALAGPLAASGDLRAVPALRKMLHDPSTNAATAAAAALRDLGTVIREGNPQLARDVASELQAALEQAGNNPTSLGFREALAEALVPLRDPRMIPTLYRLLRESGSTRLRWAALRALGELRDPKTADTIGRYLEDRDSDIRHEAVRALGKTSAVEHAEQIYQRMGAVEADISVREEAWNVLQTTFAKLPLEQLPSWSQRFALDPAKRIVVLRATIDRLTDQGQLASLHQQLGVAYMELKQPADAASQFRLAYDFYAGQDSQQMVVETLVEQYLVALLRARSYADAQVFSGKVLSQRVAYQQTVGVVFRNEARRLSDDQRWADVLALGEAARKITPALASRYVEEIAAMERQARQSLPATVPATL